MTIPSTDTACNTNDAEAEYVPPMPDDAAATDEATPAAAAAGGSPHTTTGRSRPKTKPQASPAERAIPECPETERKLLLSCVADAANFAAA
ncbi:MAG: hypothetical protein ACP5QA_14845, partial [Phycisphaerae bacterium]